LRARERVLAEVPVGDPADVARRDAGRGGRHALRPEVAADGDQGGEDVAAVHARRDPRGAPTLAPERVPEVAEAVGRVVDVDQEVAQVGAREAVVDQLRERDGGLGLRQRGQRGQHERALGRVDRQRPIGRHARVHRRGDGREVRAEGGEENIRVERDAEGRVVALAVARPGVGGNEVVVEVRPAPRVGDGDVARLDPLVQRGQECELVMGARDRRRARGRFAEDVGRPPRGEEVGRRIRRELATAGAVDACDVRDGRAEGGVARKLEGRDGQQGGRVLPGVAPPGGEEAERRAVVAGAQGAAPRDQRRQLGARPRGEDVPAQVGVGNCVVDDQRTEPLEHLDGAGAGALGRVQQHFAPPTRVVVHARDQLVLHLDDRVGRLGQGGVEEGEHEAVALGRGEAPERPHVVSGAPRGEHGTHRGRDGGEGRERHHAERAQVGQPRQQGEQGGGGLAAWERLEQLQPRAWCGRGTLRGTLDGITHRRAAGWRVHRIA